MAAKKTPVRKSDFQKQTKSYFSSLSARGCTKLYINLPGREDELVLCNADPDLLATYSLKDLVSIHSIRPTKEYMDTFREIFFAGGDPYQPYLIKTEFITKAFKDYRVEDALSRLDEKKQLQILGGGKLVTVTESSDDEDELSEEKEKDWDFKDELEKLLEDDGWDTEVKRAVFSGAGIAGVPLNDPYIVQLIEDQILQMEADLKFCKEHQNEIVIFNEKDLLAEERIHANWLRTPPFLVSKFAPDIPEDKSLKQSILLVDGLSVPSVREFLKKRKWVDNATRFHLYVYLYSPEAVKVISEFTSEQETIITARPYFHEVLLVAQKPEKRKDETKNKEV